MRINIGKDVPTKDVSFPPGMIGLSFGVENLLVHGIFYYAQGQKASPTVILCHGFPGFEKNADIAQTLRRAGFNVFIFSYRGAWGSQGDFTFANVITDTCKAVCYIKSDEFPLKERVNGQPVILIGHSMGGFAAVMAAARLPEVRHVISIAGWNIGLNAKESRRRNEVKERVNTILSGAKVLSGITSAALWNEIYLYENEYDLCHAAQNFAGRRMLLIAAERDDDTPADINHIPLLGALRSAKAAADEVYIDADHSFAEKRIELANAILRWLDKNLCEI
ncbi:MAG: alpha/beta hydrolase [Synergistaceae bacterium]|nr:alpha/beta hydrolase [Synergistaceae bacterium]